MAVVVATVVPVPVVTYIFTIAILLIANLLLVREPS